MTPFAAAARDWNALVRDVGEAFVTRHLDKSMQLAVALHCQKNADAEHAACGISSAELQDFVALSVILRRLLEAATRDHMTFLLPGVSSCKKNQISSLRTEQSDDQSLPKSFEQRFRQLLAMHWKALIEAGECATHFLPRLLQMDSNVSLDQDNGQRIHLRVQTSDGRTRKIYVPAKQFHELRYSVALVLLEMNRVEAHPIMRLTCMGHSRRTNGSQ